MALTGRRGFSGGRRGIRLRLDGAEVQVLGDLLDQLTALVGSPAPVEAPSDPLAAMMGPDDDERPSDPALLRLFPDGYLSDEEAAGEFRRYTQGGLRRQRSERLEAARAVIARMPTAPADQVATAEVTPAEADALLVVINDLRLVLGVRLGIVADDQDVVEDWDDDDPRRATFGVYQWLTWLQAGLLDVLPGGGA